MTFAQSTQKKNRRGNCLTTKTCQIDFDEEIIENLMVSRKMILQHIITMCAINDQLCDIC